MHSSTRIKAVNMRKQIAIPFSIHALHCRRERDISVNSLLLRTSREDFGGELKMKINCYMLYFLFYIATI